MPLIPNVSRKSWRMRLFVATVYLCLGVGAVTMVYPFMLMLITSITSTVDAEEYRIVPRYLYNNQILFTKYLESKYGVMRTRSVQVEELKKIFDQPTPIFHFTDVQSPDVQLPKTAVDSICADYQQFTRQLNRENPGYVKVYFIGNVSPRISFDNPGPSTVLYRNHLREKFKGDIAAMNKQYGIHADDFALVLPPLEQPLLRSWMPPVNDPQYLDWLTWRETIDQQRYLAVAPLEPLYHEFLRNTYQSTEAVVRPVDVLNEKWNSAYSDFDKIPLSSVAPAGTEERLQWSYFVKRRVNVQYLCFDDGADPAYRAFLSKLYLRSEANLSAIEEYNVQHKTSYSSFNDISLPDSITLVEGLELADIIRFLEKPESEGGCPAELITLATPESIYQNFLHSKYGDIAALNKTYAAGYTSFADIDLPIKTIEWAEVTSNTRQLRWYFLYHNYDVVLRFMAVHGRGILNTAILCAGAIIFALTVNPFCAYALSRFEIKASNKILIFLLATMAFPPAVSLIPSFLLLRNLSLLNTYWALLLPTAANGFTIFMMKGFFDTLPNEIFEAAKIDGANEVRIFFQIMAPLCGPVFAFFALGAFTSAYGAFFWAFTVCRDPKMWTLMVWLYELQNWQAYPVQMASLVLAAIPTLLVFILVQNIILKGIVLPSYH